MVAPVHVVATQFIRRLRGGAQSRLMLCSDGNAYIVKFQNNPQSLRVLANEWLATQLAEMLGLPVPSCAIVEVSDFLIENTRDAYIDYGQHLVPCKSGPQFGSRLVGGLLPGRTVDYLPDERLARVVNLASFVGILTFDKWTCNMDGRQAVFDKKGRDQPYQATFIDQGYCFGGPEWKFVDAPLRGVYAKSLVYDGVTGWESFEPWISRIEEFDPTRIAELAATIPREWLETDENATTFMVSHLINRRERVRELIIQFRESSRNPFPNWLR